MRGEINDQKEVREAAGLTQVALGEIVGVEQHTISQ